jgi:hypothetical protein
VVFIFEVKLTYMTGNPEHIGSSAVGFVKTPHISAVITVFGTVAEMENGGSFCRRNFEIGAVGKVIVDILSVRIGTDPVTDFIGSIVQSSCQISAGEIVTVHIGCGKIGSCQRAGE